MIPRLPVRQLKRRFVIVFLHRVGGHVFGVTISLRRNKQTNKQIINQQTRCAVCSRLSTVCTYFIYEAQAYLTKHQQQTVIS